MAGSSYLRSDERLDTLLDTQKHREYPTQSWPISQWEVEIHRRVDDLTIITSQKQDPLPHREVPFFRGLWIEQLPQQIIVV